MVIFQGCPKLGKRDNWGLSLNGAKKEGGRCHPPQEISQKTPLTGRKQQYIRTLELQFDEVAVFYKDYADFACVGVHSTQ